VTDRRGTVRGICYFFTLAGWSIMTKRRAFVVLAIAFLAMPRAAAQAQQTNPAYTLDDVVVLLQGGHSTARILARVTPDCIAFRVDAAAAALRDAGADTALIEALRQVCYRAPAARPQQQQQQQSRDMGIFRIEGALPPGWVRIVNEIPPSTNREISMTPGRRNTVIVTAPGWCPRTVEITLQAGEQRAWTPVLRARPWVGECTHDGV
jgi:hypothetical protein